MKIKAVEAVLVRAMASTAHQAAFAEITKKRAEKTNTGMGAAENIFRVRRGPLWMYIE